MNVTSGGQVNLSGEFGNFVLGKFAGSSGAITIDGEGTLWTSDRNTNIIGKEGAGSLVVTGGGHITTSHTVMGQLAGASGNVTIDGPGSAWTSRSCICIGESGTGSLTVTGGGQASAADGIPGTVDNVVVRRTGSVNVSGAGSIVTAESNFFAGLANDMGGGTAMVSVTDGGQIISGRGSIGQGTSGTVLIDGPGSKWISSFGLDVGLGSNGIGQLDIKDGGEVSNVGAVVGAISASGMVTVDGSNSKWTSSGNLFVINGTVLVMSDGQLTSTNSSVGDDSFNSESTALVHINGAGSEWNNFETQSFQRNGRLSITDGALVRSTHAQINRQAMVDVGGAGSKWILSGDLTVEEGTLTVSNGGAVSASGVISVESSGSFQGTLHGDGTIHGTVVNRGVVSPGNSAGALEIDGNLIQSALGKLQFELGGTTAGASYDQLLVSDLVSLAGTLEVTTIDMFAPQVGNAFNILDWGSLSGTFSTIELPLLSPGLGWDTSQLYTTGVLTIVESPLGDYNRNGVVDAADYTVWRDTLGQTVSIASGADGDSDGSIDDGDYTIWKTNFGAVAGSGSGLVPPAATGAVVPEPSSALAFMLSGLLVAHDMRRRQHL